MIGSNSSLKQHNLATIPNHRYTMADLISMSCLAGLTENIGYVLLPCMLQYALAAAMAYSIMQDAQARQ